MLSRNLPTRQRGAGGAVADFRTNDQLQRFHAGQENLVVLQFRDRVGRAEVELLSNNFREGRIVAG